MSLKDKKCVSSTSDTLPLPVEERINLKEQIHSDWILTNDNNRLRREFKFKGFKKPWALLNKVAEISEEQFHHPELSLGWGHLEIEIWSHNIGSLVESDFILAAKIDEAAQEYA